MDRVLRLVLVRVWELWKDAHGFEGTGGRGEIRIKTVGVVLLSFVDLSIGLTLNDALTHELGWVAAVDLSCSNGTIDNASGRCD